jgi:hypothetical protein
LELDRVLKINQQDMFKKAGENRPKKGPKKGVKIT